MRKLFPFRASDSVQVKEAPKLQCAGSADCSSTLQHKNFLKCLIFLINALLELWVLKSDHIFSM